MVLLVEWSSFRGGLKAGFYRVLLLVYRLNESSDDTLTHSYNQETFEETATSSSPTKKTKKAPKSPLEGLKRTMIGMSSPRSPRALFTPKGPTTRTSESESEDSYSIGSQRCLLKELKVHSFHSIYAN